jgi:hypothetical protein
MATGIEKAELIGDHQGFLSEASKCVRDRTSALQLVARRALELRYRIFGNNDDAPVCQSGDMEKTQSPHADELMDDLERLAGVIEDLEHSICVLEGL